MNRWLEALLFGLGSLAVQAAAWAVLLVGMEWPPVAMWVVALLTTAGIAALAYAAGRRGSILGLVAVVAFPLVAQLALVAANSVPLL